MSVYVKKELKDFVKDVQDDTVGVGIMGVGVSTTLVLSAFFSPLLSSLSSPLFLSCVYAQHTVSDQTHTTHTFLVCSPLIASKWAFPFDATYTYRACLPACL